MLQAARVDAAGMVSFMRTLDRRHAGTPRLVSYLSTHPHTGDRIEALERLAAGGTYRPEPLMAPAEWAQARQVCGPP